MATINMLIGQKVTLAVVKTKAGIDADVVGIPSWSTTDATVAVISPSTDGLTCEVTAKASGSATVAVAAQGSGALNASHTVQVGSSNLADAVAITMIGPPA